MTRASGHQPPARVAGGVAVVTAVMLGLVWSFTLRTPAGGARTEDPARPIAAGAREAPANSASAATAELPTTCAPHVQVRLFFGLSTPTGPVSEADWSRFLHDVVTPRFPRGLTVLHADGQWQSQGTAGVQHEPSQVVEIVDDSSDIGGRIAEIVAIYRERFRQESVLVTRGSVDVCS